MILAADGLPFNLVLAFGGGMLSFLSPCVLPLVPGYLSMMSGVGGSQLAVATRTDTAKLLRSTLLFVAGFTVVFVMLGATATALGQTLLRNKDVLERVSGVVVIVLGLFLAGAVQFPALMRERRFHVAPDSLGVFAAPVMGMAFAFGWTPCIGPILSVVLTQASASATVGDGIALLIAYSLGLGVPFVAAGVGFGRLTGVFGFVKRHFRVLNLISGAFLVLFGVLLFTHRIGQVSAAIIDAMNAVGLGFLTEI